MHHQAVDPLGLLDRGTIAVGQGRVAGNTPGQILRFLLIPIEIGSERIVGQGGVGRSDRRYVLACSHHAGCMGLTGVAGPDIGGDILAPMAGVAGHPGATYVVTPGDVGVLGHHRHHPCDTFGVLGVVLEALIDVAIVAAFLGRDPLGHGGHDAGEFAHAQVAQHLHILVDIPGLWARRGDCRLRGRGLVLRHGGRQGSGIGNVLLPHAPVAQLNGFRRRSFTPCEK